MRMATIERFEEMLSWQKARELNRLDSGFMACLRNSELKGIKFKKPEPHPRTPRTSPTLDIRL